MRRCANVWPSRRFSDRSRPGVNTRMTSCSRSTKRSAFPMSAESVPLTRPGAIVLCRPDRVGDAIIASACFPAVREKFPDRPLYYLARPVMAPLYEGHPHLAGFLPRPESAPELVQKLREIGAAIFVHLHTDPLCYRAAWSAGVPVRIGYRHWLGWTLTDSRADER